MRRPQSGPYGAQVRRLVTDDVVHGDFDFFNLDAGAVISPSKLKKYPRTVDRHTLPLMKSSTRTSDPTAGPSAQVRRHATDDLIHGAFEFFNVDAGAVISLQVHGGTASTLTTLQVLNILNTAQNTLRNPTALSFFRGWLAIDAPGAENT